MSEGNTTESLDINIDAWREEIKVFADDTQNSLNAISDLLRSGNAEAVPSVVKKEDKQENTGNDTESATTPIDAEEAGGRLDRLRAELAKKFSDKQN